MKRAICMLETNTVPDGLQAADALMKAAAVELLRAHPICPGRFMVLAAGEVGNVKAALRAAEVAAGKALRHSMVLANLHESVIAMLGGERAEPVGPGDAVGAVETITTTSAILAADAAVKAAPVRLVRVRLAQGMSGKSYFTVAGAVGPVRMAVAAGEAAAQENGHFKSSVVLPSPHPGLWTFL